MTSEGGYLNIHTYQGIPGITERNNDERIASWQKLAYGMFIHWGPYSVLGGERKGEPVTAGYSEQIQMWADIPESEYLQVAKDLSDEQFDPDAICQLARDAGMRYIVITSKHHDGFSMFDTETTDYNAMKKSQFGADPLALLADACERYGLKFGVYFSLVDWHLGHEFDPNNNNPIPASMEPIMEQQLRELMTNYGPIAEVWFDMSSPTAWQSKKFTDIVHELQPEAMINSRIWNNAGDFRTLGDNQIPAETLDGAWQTPASIYHETWGYRKWQKRDDVLGKVRTLAKGLVSVRARGGNYLLNIGPRGNGSVVEFEQEVLEKIGKWVGRHQSAITDAMPTQFDTHSWGEITYNDDHLYLHVMDVPEDGKIMLSGLATGVNDVVVDGLGDKLVWELKDNRLTFQMPKEHVDDILPVVRVELTDELFVIPERTVYENDQGKWEMGMADFYVGHGFADKGNYNSLTKTTVRQTAFIASTKEGRLGLTLQVKVKDASREYRVDFGLESKVLTGQQLVDSEMGSFEIGANEIVAMSITLAEPDYVEEDLDLELETLYVERVE